MVNGNMFTYVFVFFGPLIEPKDRCEITQPLKRVGKRGEGKWVVCALRVAQGQHLTEMTGKQCIYLIDDFASVYINPKSQKLTPQIF